MNIFATSDDPRLCALWLDDVRANKMTVETAQLLSTAIHVIQPRPKLDIYKMSYVNHPCSLWARESRNNFRWLIDHLKALRERNPYHASAKLLPTFELFADVGKFPHEEATPFRKVTGLYKMLGNVNAAYRLYLIDKWKNGNIPVTWDSGQRPPWFKLQMG